MAAKTRTEKVIKNTFAGILTEIIKLVCGLVLPRLVLTNFGSLYNGITQSVSQFLTCIALMKSGIGGATRAALFKPLAEKDDNEISEVLSATETFMRRIALIYAIFVITLACCYPLFINNTFGWFFTFTLILIVSFGTFAEYYFGFTYSMLLIADQKDYIVQFLGIITTVLNTVVAVILIKSGCSIHTVNLGSAIVCLINPLFLYIYCHKKYNLIKINKINKNKIPQRWSAFAHEIASFVNDNTDIMVLTVFCNLLEVSVYTVYHYVVVNLKKMMSTFVSGFGSAFGDMFAKNEKERISQNLDLYEFITFSFTSVIYSTALVMIIPFIMLYTKGVTDVNYKRVTFSIIFILAGAFNCFRYPYKQIINNTGNYKQTQHIAIIEATLNIVISIAMVIKYGLIGVAIGTLIAMMFGAISYSHYVSTKIVNRKAFKPYQHMFVSLLIFGITYFISSTYICSINNYFIWIMYASITCIVAILITLILDMFFYKDQLLMLIVRIRFIIKKRREE